MQNAVTPFQPYVLEGQAEEAMNLYVRTIPDSEILNVQNNGPDGPGPEGSVILASISLRGHLCSKTRLEWKAPIESLPSSRNTVPRR